MSKAFGLRWTVVIAGAMLLALAAACGGETEIVEVEKEVIVEKEVVKEVPVEVERVVEVEKEVVKEVVREVPVEVVKEVEVIKEVPKVITEEKVVVREVEVEKVVEVEREVDPRYGGKLVWSGHGFPGFPQPSFKVGRETITGYHVLIFDALMAWDSKLNVSPQMAESFEVKDGGRHFVFRLRDNLKFHNGDSVDSGDVVASLNRWLEDDTFNVYVVPNLVGDGITAVDDRTIEVRVTRPNGQFLAQVGKTMQHFPMIMPKEIADLGGGETRLTIDQMIGSGPAVFKEYRELESSRLERFEDYVPRDEPGDAAAGGKRMFFDTIDAKYIAEQEIRVAALETRAVDLLMDIPVQYVGRLQDNLAITTEFGTPASQLTLQLNKHAGVLDNSESGRLMRQALFVGLNPADHLRAVTAGEPLWKLCPTMFSCDAWFGGKEVVPDVYNAQDIPRAKAMIAEAGYDGEELKLVVPGGTLTGGGIHLANLEVLSARLRQLGVNNKLMFPSSEEFGSWVVPKCPTRDPNVQEWHIASGSSSTWHYRVFGSQWLAKWDWRGCWNNQEFQDLKAELLETVDRAAQLEIYNEMQRVFMADPSFIFHGEIPFVHAYDADLKGYKQLTLAGLMMVGMWWENPTRR